MQQDALRAVCDRLRAARYAVSGAIGMRSTYRSIRASGARDARLSAPSQVRCSRIRRRDSLASIVTALSLLLTYGCHAGPRDADDAESRAVPQTAPTEPAPPASVQALIHWDVVVLEEEVDGRRSRHTRLTAACDPQALGGELRVSRLDPQGINPRILLVKAWIEPEPADDTATIDWIAPSIDGHWNLPFAGKDFVQIVGPAGRAGLIAIPR